VIGCAVQEWNSPSGVANEVWYYIVASSVLCYGCSKMYSVDGLEAHAPNGICKSGSKHDVPFNISSLPVCFFFFSFHFPFVGWAFLEWNLDVGVSVDAWRILSTSGIACDRCERVCSMDGDCVHRDDTGEPICKALTTSGSLVININDNEDEIIPMMDKGKG
jgi:hypothetical protein